MARIRLKIHVTGSFHGIEGGVLPGTIVDVDDFDADRYVKNEIAEYVAGTEEHAVLDTEAESAVVKPRRGRPKKQPEWDDEKAPGWKEVDNT